MTSIDGTSLTYDIFSNMKSHGSNAYTYDASGQRIRKTENGVKTHYIKSGIQILAEYDSTGDLAAEYIHGINGMIAKIHPREGLRYFYTDHLGSTRELGSTIFQRDYYPFGETMVSAGDETDYQFTGKELDNNTGLYYFGARYYDPAIGRWLTVDPMAEKTAWLSPYVYCQNNPINRFDPDGAEDWWAAARAGLRIVYGGLHYVAAAKLTAGIGVTVPLTGGASLALTAGAAGLIIRGGSEVALGISDLDLALRTPHGMKAESYGTLVNIVGEQFGVSELGQDIINLAVSIATGAKDIPKHMYSAEILKVIDAFIKGGQVTEDLVQILKGIHENENQMNEDMKNDDKKKKDEEEEEERNR